MKTSLSSLRYRESKAEECVSGRTPQKILNSFSFSPIIKMGAVRAFIEMGLFKEGEPVRTNIDGEERLVEVRSTGQSLFFL